MSPTPESSSIKAPSSSEIGFRNNDALANPGDDTQHMVTAERAEVNVFFDGTGNNFYNVTATEKLHGEASYENALSNIARLWSGIDFADHTISLYIDGIGTTRKRPDNLTGTVLGMGETGVIDRVDSAFPASMQLVKNKRGKRSLPAIVEFNVFGFSRGAAAARRFVHLVATERHRFDDPDWQATNIQCNFVGLFDTVASYGLDHENDVTDLHLNFAPNYAQKVFHLIAGDEYRHHFPVTTTASALALRVPTHSGSECMGYELRIPGAHSDVGGGYGQLETENRIVPPNVRDFVYEQGWYSAPDQTNAFLGTHQRQVQGDFHKVGLALMMDKAHEYSTTQFPPELLKPIANPDIQMLQDTLRAFAKDEKNTIWDISQRWAPDKAKAARHQFIHQSFTNSGAMLPHMEDGGPRRQYLPG